MKNLIAGALVLMAAAFVTPVVAQQDGPAPNTTAECNRAAEESDMRLWDEEEHFYASLGAVQTKMNDLSSFEREEIEAAVRAVRSKKSIILEAIVACYRAARDGVDISLNIDEIHRLNNEKLSSLRAAIVILGKYVPTSE